MHNPDVGRSQAMGVMRLCLAFICLLWSGVLVLRAGTHYVSLQGTNDVANGYITWTGAATQIQWAVSVATNGETVLVSNGTYNLTNQINIFSNITVRSFTEQGHGTNDTFINGNYPAYTNRCFYITNGAVLNGFTISNGYAGVTDGGRGGGVFVTNVGSVYNCFIYKNYCSNDVGSYGGGGIYMWGSASAVSNCAVVSNIAYEGITAASSRGGGIRGLYGSVFASEISGNRAYEGGGIFYEMGTLFTNCTIANNLATNSGGMWGGYRVRNCVFSNNVARNDYGGAYMANASTLYDSIIISNRAYRYTGGLSLFQGGSASNCLLIGNHSAGNGGGVSLNDLGGTWGISVLANSVIRENIISSGQGGGVLRTDGTIRNCLIVSNTGEGLYSQVGSLTPTYTSVVESCTIAANSGGGLWLYSATNVIQNCVIYANAGYDMQFGATAGSNNCRYICTSFTNLPPNQGNITNNPLFVDPGSINYRLSANSPCINRGMNQNWMTNAYDLDGRARIRYGTVDMGAYELINSGTIYSFH